MFKKSMLRKGKSFSDILSLQNPICLYYQKMKNKKWEKIPQWEDPVVWDPLTAEIDLSTCQMYLEIKRKEGSIGWLHIKWFYSTNLS